MRRVGLAGWSGSGKTRLVLSLIGECAKRSLSVSTLKHAHHSFDIDHEGKDSFRHRKKGAREVLVASQVRWALMHEQSQSEGSPSLEMLLSRLIPVDLVLIEGFKASPHAKLEVFRACLQRPLLAESNPSVQAIVSDVELPNAPRPILNADEPEAVLDFILQESAFLLTPELLAPKHAN